MKIEQIRRLIKAKQYSISKHAFTEAFEDKFSIKDILEAVDKGEIIEEYADRHRCLIYAKLGRRQIHVVIDYSSTDWIWIVTIYGPDPVEWMGGKIRRQL